MKNTFKVFGIAIIVAVIGFSMIACDNGTGDDGTGGTGGTGGTSGNPNTSLNGVWVHSSGGLTVTVSGKIGIISSMTNASPLWTDAVSKGYVTVGSSQYWRNLTSTGNLTWSGQEMRVTYNTSSPNIAISTDWNTSRRITMNADGQTITVSNTDGSGATTYTRQ